MKHTENQKKTLTIIFSVIVDQKGIRSFYSPKDQPSPLLLYFLSKSTSYNYLTQYKGPWKQLVSS